MAIFRAFPALIVVTRSLIQPLFPSHAKKEAPEPE